MRWVWVTLAILGSVAIIYLVMANIGAVQKKKEDAASKLGTIEGKKGTRGFWGKVGSSFLDPLGLISG